MTDYIQALRLADLTPGEITPIRLRGYDLAFYLVDGQAYCTEDLCTHEDNLLSEGGFLNGDEVECAHGARFNVKTGRVTRFPASASIPSFPTEMREGYVNVAL